MRLSRSIRFLLSAVLVVLVAMTFSGVVVTEAVLHPHRREPGAKSRERAQRIADFSGARLEDVQIAAADGVALRGWLFRARESGGKAVIVLHGQANNRAGMLAYVRPFLAQQYDVLTPDSRAQGESGGTKVTYGLKEADDVNRWAEWLTREQADRQVFGLGESMGGAILLQALRGESRFVAVVAESSFSSLREAAYDRVAEQVGCGAWLGRTLLRPIVDTGFWYARLRYGLNLDEISPAGAVASARVPILLIHGADDRNIPPAHSRRILASGHGRVELWLAPQTGHTGALGRWPAEFDRRVSDWFNAASAGK